MTDISKETVRPMCIKGPDGISRSFEEHYDTMMEVEQDPTGAFIAIQAQAARIEQLEAAIKRQAGAAKTLRELTLSEVQHLKDKDRSEYAATKTIESEREANAILTDRVEQLEAELATARNDALKEAAKVVDEKADQYAAKSDTYRGGSLLNTNYRTLCNVVRSIVDDIRAISEGKA